MPTLLKTSTYGTKHDMDLHSDNEIIHKKRDKWT